MSRRDPARTGARTQAVRRHGPGRERAIGSPGSNCLLASTRPGQTAIGRRALVRRTVLVGHVAGSVVDDADGYVTDGDFPHVGRAARAAFRACWRLTRSAAENSGRCSSGRAGPGHGVTASGRRCPGQRACSRPARSCPPRRSDPKRHQAQVASTAPSREHPACPSSTSPTAGRRRRRRGHRFGRRHEWRTLARPSPRSERVRCARRRRMPTSHSAVPTSLRHHTRQRRQRRPAHPVRRVSSDAWAEYRNPRVISPRICDACGAMLTRAAKRC